MKKLFRGLVSQAAIKVNKDRLSSFLSSFIENTVELDKIGKKPYLGCFAEESTDLFLKQNNFFRSFRDLLARLDKEIEAIKV